MTAADLVVVRLERLPVGLMREASEHQDELRREFSMMAQQSSADETNVPRRLLRLRDELEAHFAAFSAGPNAAVTAAIERGEESIDLEYRVPPEAKGACITLGALLDEADEFCRRGDHLLTLATPEGALALRHWFLAEFIAQIDGADPTPWDQWDPDATDA